MRQKLAARQSEQGPLPASTLPLVKIVHLIRTPFTILVGLLATAAAATTVIVMRLLRVGQELPNQVTRTWARTILWAGGVHLTVSGADRVDPDRAYVVVSNHQGTFDIMSHFLAVPVPIRFLAKQELFRVPLLGAALRSLDMVPVDRYAGRPVYDEVEKNAAVAASRGNSLIVYPEGTRTNDGELLPFKNGAFHIAIRLGLPVLPTTINGSFEAWLPRAKVIPGGNVEVMIGEPVPTVGMTMDQVPELRDRIRMEIETTLARLRAAP